MIFIPPVPSPASPAADPVGSGPVGAGPEPGIDELDGTEALAN
ncbi:MAG: hypothetical protein JWP61_2610, partial [Friedmanniella sp.]|nr:hypothetical protein [Friedmanniella sp.]